MTHAPDNIRSGRESEDRTAIVGEHWYCVYRHVFRLCGNSHDAEELTQEAFLRAFLRFDQFSCGSNLRGWLLRIATNAFLDTKRRPRRERHESEAAGMAGGEPPASTILERNELAGQVQQALLQLTETQRAVFVLRVVEEMPFSDIAESVGTSEATARWHMLRARQQLLKLLGGVL